MQTATIETAKQAHSLTGNTIKLGVYKHYKGDLYEVLGVARHSETLEELVVYQGMHYSAEFGNGPLWVRPASMFVEVIEYNGSLVSRFEFVGI